MTKAFYATFVSGQAERYGTWTPANRIFKNRDDAQICSVLTFVSPVPLPTMVEPTVLAQLNGGGGSHGGPSQNETFFLVFAVGFDSLFLDF